MPFAVPSVVELLSSPQPDAECSAACSSAGNAAAQNAADASRGAAAWDRAGGVRVSPVPPREQAAPQRCRVQRSLLSAGVAAQTLPARC